MKCLICREPDPKKFYRIQGKPKTKCIECCKKSYRASTAMKRNDLEFRKKQAENVCYGTE